MEAPGKMATLDEATRALLGLKAMLRSAPQGELDPAIVGDRVREVLQSLAGAQVQWIGPAEARGLLGVESEKTVEAWASMGLLRSRTAADGRLEVMLEDVLHRRAEREGLMAIGGEDLTPDELRILSQERPGKNPWERDGADRPR